MISFWKRRFMLLGAIALLASLIMPAGARQATAAPLGQAAPGGVQRNVTYCNAGGVALKMDLYFPLRTDDKLAPAIVYVHGGSWRAGDKAEVLAGPVEVTGYGYVVASVNYRLAPQHKWPAQIEDVKCAVRHLRANAATYKIDPNRIVAWGSSAGGHLAALAALAGPQAGFEGNGGYAEQSSQLQAVIDMFGPTDFTAPELRASPREVEDLLGVPVSQAGERLRLASPVTYVSRDAPPFLIIHGDKDQVVPLSQSQILHERLQAAGANSTLVVVKNAGHGFTAAGGPLDPSIDQLREIILGFLDTHLMKIPTGSHTFPETGRTVKGRFFRYWLTRGGLAQQGYPISEEMQEKSDTDGKTYRVQYFERAVFEYHPENRAPHDVLLQLLGTFRYAEKYPAGAPGQQPNTSPSSVLFPETGRRLGGRFLQYWRANGGLPQQGYPISDEFTEVSDLDGKPYLVQYFERAVFEYHPENPPPNDVLLSQLGTFRYRAKYGATP